MHLSKGEIIAGAALDSLRMERDAKTRTFGLKEGACDAILVADVVPA